MARFSVLRLSAQRPVRWAFGVVRSRRARAIEGAGLALVVLVLIVWLLPKAQVPTDPALSSKERFDIENDARVTIAQIVGGLGLFAALYFTWKRVAAAERTVQLTEQAQSTERFTRAIEQLGDEKHLEIRLGGIYALERIARDSERDHWPIMEVLTAFIREKAPLQTDEQVSDEERDEMERSDAGAEPEHYARPASRLDIAAILTVIGRREMSAVREEGRVLDLRSCDLREAELPGARLGRANLRGANLAGASLRGAYLSGADLSYTVMDGTHLAGADLTGVGAIR